MADQRSRELESGFTLVELLAVVVIVGVLATLATFAVRKYILAAKTGEALSMINVIRAAQEAYRAETFTYLDVSGEFDVFFPPTPPGPGKISWDGHTGPQADGFRTLGVSAGGPVYYRYAVVARPAGVGLPALPSDMQRQNFNFPSAPTEPSYAVLAMGDLDGDKLFSFVLAHSYSSEVYVENEGE